MKKALEITGITLLSLGIIYYCFFTLNSYEISEQELVKSYQYEMASVPNLELTDNGDNTFDFTFETFDGTIVPGRISYPAEKADKYPVLMGIHAMGRSYPRWWVDAIRGRPTESQANKITKLATDKGYVVIAIDSRDHGKRKNPEKSLKSIMIDLKLLGDRSGYEKMVLDTARDYRVLMDWVETQPQLENQVTVAGYSMGGQISLLLGGIDSRVSRVLSIVPPHLNDKTALVAPKNVAHRLQGKTVMLITSNDDEYSSQQESQQLFSMINAKNKQTLEFKGTHIIKENYVKSLSDWF